MNYKTWNDCKGLETLARAECTSLEAAKAFTTEAGGPNRIIAEDGQEWMRAAHADSAPYWVGPYPAGYLERMSAHPYRNERPQGCSKGCTGRMCHDALNCDAKGRE